MAKRALISVTNKEGLPKFKELTDLGWWIISTGGTGKALAEAGISYIPIEVVTGFPEMMDGRLKTLHPKVFGGILADQSNPVHMTAIASMGIKPIDLVVVNLYEFTKKLSIEGIDIGGPSLLRAAAKNWESVTVIVDPADYDRVISEIVETGNTSRQTRLELADKVFAHTSDYDHDIHMWFFGLISESRPKTFTRDIQVV